MGTGVCGPSGKKTYKLVENVLEYLKIVRREASGAGVEGLCRNIDGCR